MMVGGSGGRVGVGITWSVKCQFLFEMKKMVKFSSGFSCLCVYKYIHV